MSDSQRADLLIAHAVTIQKQEVGDALVRLGKRDTFRSRNRYASHDSHVRKLVFKFLHMPWTKKFRGCSQMQQFRIEAQDNLPDESNIRRKAQDQTFSWLPDCGKNRFRLLD